MRLGHFRPEFGAASMQWPFSSETSRRNAMQSACVKRSQTSPEKRSFDVLWRPDPKPEGFATVHSEKLIKKIKTPETRRFEGFRYSCFGRPTDCKQGCGVECIESHHALLRASVRHTYECRARTPLFDWTAPEQTRSFDRSADIGTIAPQSRDDVDPSGGQPPCLMNSSARSSGWILRVA